MYLISHRGNIHGPCPETENTPLQIFHALNLGFHCEIDIWNIDRQWFLGHDSPTYSIDIDLFSPESSKLWLHCKNYHALDSLRDSNFNYFWHDQDNYVLTSRSYIWALPGMPISQYNSVYVMPEKVCYPFTSNFIDELKETFAICTDYPDILKHKFAT